MQIGWCSSVCQFDQDSLFGIGVGDTEGSYGYDGSKRKVWHVQCYEYGITHWRAGDILGVCLDMDEGILKYYRNGNYLGEAFNNIPTGKDNKLYPAVTLAFQEEIRANFGGTPFRFPVTGFLPLQNAPSEQIYKCECLLIYMADLAHFLSKKPNIRKKDVIKMGDGSIVSIDAVLLVFASMIIERLSGLLRNAYIIQSCVFPYLKQLCMQGKNSIQPGSEHSTLGNFLKLLWDHLDYDDMTYFLKEIMKHMENVYQEISNDMDYGKQRNIIVVITCLCNHSKTRKFLLTDIFFENNW